ncbi:MAG: hypothetical protein J5858_04690 [Lentisphaeria bacterium]|nr:hypothetical protein [Lentisphaeria bacterium]
MKFSIFEVIMLICFGFSWPFAIIKTIRVKNPAGKSYLFMGLVIIGYIAGCIHKILYHWDFVFWLYLLNTLLVATDFILCMFYSRQLKKGKKDL